MGDEYFAGVLQQWLDEYKDDPDMMEELQQFVREDRISELPTDHLVHILSLLDPKDAAKTSILSHRWRYVWLQIPDIKLDLRKMFQRFIHENVCNLGEVQTFRDCQNNFTRQANDIIDLYKRRGPSTIRSFEVACFLDAQTDVSSSLDKWVRFAIRARVEKIEILLYGIESSLKKYHVPDWVFSNAASINRSTLKHLSLRRCLVDNNQADLGGLRNLISLRLKEVRIEEDFMTRLYATALMLRELTLERCYFMSGKFHLFGSSVIHLKLLNGVFLDDIGISSPILATFNFAGQASKISLFEAPSLSALTFHLSDSNHHQSRFLRSLPQLENLALFIDKPQVEALPNSMNAPFKRLNELLLLLVTRHVGDLSWFTTILRSSPQLQKLVLQLQLPKSMPRERPGTKLDMKKPDGFVHDNLKEVEILGCQGFWFEAEIEKFLSEVAVNLERKVIGPMTKVFQESGEWTDVNGDDDDHSTWSSSERKLVRGSLFQNAL